MKHLGDASDAGGLLGCTLGVVPSHQHVYLAAAGRSGADRVEGGGLDGLLIVFGDYQRCHGTVSFARS
jgi:hypothetical protein